MPIDGSALDAVARAYVADMTSIRGRRVHRLLVREFRGFDHVVEAVAEGGVRVVLAVSDDGGVGVCGTDGRGSEAAVSTWPHLPGATVTALFDLTKDSLPVTRWTLEHPALAGFGGVVTISVAGRPTDEQQRIAQAVRAIGR
jgi:hypothetical protein